jgi:hypothetical protein
MMLKLNWYAILMFDVGVRKARSEARICLLFSVFPRKSTNRAYYLEFFYGSFA